MHTGVVSEIREIPTTGAPVLGKGVEECWMDFDGARMRYLRAGSGPAIILLHGLMGYSFSWRYVMPALAPLRTCYAPDMLGAGFSDRPEVDHSMRATGLRLLRFAEGLKLDSLDLLGTSRGGAVAMSAAAESMGEAVHQAVTQMATQLDSKAESLPARKAEFSGLVADVSGNTIILNIGRNSGVQVGDTVDINRPIRTVKDPSTGKVIKTVTNKMGTATITEVDSDSATANFTGSAPAKVGDAAKSQ